MQNYLKQLLTRHRRLDRKIDGWTAVHRQDELKRLKLMRLHLRDKIAALRRHTLQAG